MMLVADFGNLAGPITPDDVRKLRRAGIEGAMIGLQYPSNGSGIAHQQIECILESPVELIACYAESQDVDQIWHHVAQFAKDIPQVFKAVEEDVITVDRADIDRNLDFIDALGLKKRGGIYTRAGFWTAQEYVHWFGDRDLAVAQYDGNADPDVFSPFGDWFECQIKQFQQEVRVGRLLVDLNVTRDW